MKTFHYIDRSGQIHQLPLPKLDGTGAASRIIGYLQSSDKPLTFNQLQAKEWDYKESLDKPLPLNINPNFSQIVGRMWSSGQIKKVSRGVYTTFTNTTLKTEE